MERTKTGGETAAELTAEEIVEAALPQQASFTMYGAANAMSVIVGQRVREQMLYNYRAKRLIRVNGEGRVTREELVAFIAKRLRKAAAQ
jgi:hypothetical protein